jgi:hypothetical protein
MDYQEAYIIKKYTPNLDNNKNYVDISDDKFYFNNYKTNKHYDTQIININSELVDILYIYMKFHPLKKDFKNKNFIVPFLVDYKGQPLKSINSITRYLNTIFNKKIGVSKLRAIYLTSKYKDNNNDKINDAYSMGTSTGTMDNIYIKQ